MAWLLLAGAIVTEIIATLMLRGTAETFRALPMLSVIVGYVVSFVLMAYALRSLNVATVYAIWSGVGTAGVAAFGALIYGEHLNLSAVGGIALIVVGVAVLASSGSVSHG